MRTLLITVSVMSCGTVSSAVDAGAMPVTDAGGLAIDAGLTDAGVDSGVADAGARLIVDRDLDGLDDAWEADVAERYLPVLALHPQDRCPRGGLVFRLRPHPMDPDGGLLAVTWTHLYERDCGLTSHVGDNEAFGATIDRHSRPSVASSSCARWRIRTPSALAPARVAPARG
ncbi:MAG: hypothetical protein Q8L14_32545 [Myxococcales bacterium]|nr:hypothetical protein [Myxococcales bacterium]